MRCLCHTRDFSRRVVVLIFAVMLAVGLLSGMTYSMPVDEDTEYSILKSNVAEYILQIFGEDSDLYHIFRSDVLPVSQSIERDHGISTYYLIAPFCMILNRVSPYAMMLLWHSWTFVLFMIGVCSVYGIARTLFRSSRQFGIAAALMLYLTPRMFAEGHYNNKDIVLLSLTLLVIYLGICFIQKNRFKDAVLFSIAGAFAANTKIIGVWTWGVFGLLFLIIRISHREMNGRTWRNGIAAILVLFIGYIALTPASWSNLPAFFTYLLSNATRFSRWRLFVLFEGEVTSYYSGETLPWYYLPKMMLMTIPIPVLLLSAAGLILLILHTIHYKRFSVEEREIISVMFAAALTGLVPLLIGMFSGMVVYNGWRHFYFVYGPLLLLGVYAACILKRKLDEHSTMRQLAAGFLAVCMCYHGIALIVNHPLQGSYYNPIAAQYVDGRYETDYWVLSTGPAVNGILEHAASNHENSPVCTTHPIAGYMLRQSIWRLPATNVQYTNVLDEADYYVAYHIYEDIVNIAPSDEIVRFFTENSHSYGLEGGNFPVLGWNESGEFEELFTLYSYGMKICTVYHRTQPL